MANKNGENPLENNNQTESSKNCEMALNALSYYHMKKFLLCIKDEQEIRTFGDT